MTEFKNSVTGYQIDQISLAYLSPSYLEMKMLLWGKEVCTSLIRLIIIKRFVIKTSDKIF